MTNLISGKEALIALANGDEVLWRTKNNAEVKSFRKQTPDLDLVLSGDCNYRFWIKPRTIALSLEIPASFEPKHGDRVWFVDCDADRGYSTNIVGEGCERKWIQFGAWRTEEEIKQVVAALRQIFGRSDDAVNAARGGNENGFNRT